MKNTLAVPLEVLVQYSSTVIHGPRCSGKTTFLLSVADSLWRSGVEAMIISPIRSRPHHTEKGKEILVRPTVPFGYGGAILVDDFGLFGFADQRAILDTARTAMVGPIACLAYTDHAAPRLTFTDRDFIEYKENLVAWTEYRNQLLESR